MSIMNIDLLRLSNRKLATRAVLVAEPEGTPLEAKLTCVDETQRTDKFYNIQVIAGGSDYYLYTYQGNTGADGKITLSGPHTRAKGIQEFEEVYEQKTGNSWENRQVGADANSRGLYQHLSTISRSLPRQQNDEPAIWQYYLTNDLDGKRDGWYPYDLKAGAEVEELFIDRQDNASLNTRFVHSTTSTFTYKVDLGAFTQTNTSTKKCRPIRRIKKSGGANVTIDSKVLMDQFFNNPSSSLSSDSSASKRIKSTKSTSKSAASTPAPKKKTKAKGKKPEAEAVVPPPPVMTLNLRQQYVKGLLSDRSARKYLKSVGNKEM